jgi:hypothetical protein
MASRVKHHLLTHSILCSFVANPAANCESMRNQPFPQLLHTMTDKTWWCWRRVARAFCRIAAPLTSLHSKMNLRLCLRDVVCLVLVLNSNSFGLRHTFYCRCLLSLSPFSMDEAWCWLVSWPYPAPIPHLVTLLLCTIRQLQHFKLFQASLTPISKLTHC